MQFRQFDLNLLRALDALLRERNVTRAAATLNVTQQAMSGALRRLRDQFADELLTRSGREMRLTPQAAALAEPVRAALRQLEQALLVTPSFDPATSRHRFAVAMSDYATMVILPAVMARLSTEAPGIVLDIRPLDENSLAAIDRGEIDLCLLPSDWSLFGGPPSPTTRYKALYEDDFVCVVGADNRLIGDAIDTAGYASASHTSLRLGRGVCSAVEAAWREFGIAPHVAATTTSFTAMLFLVTESPLIATVQRQLANRFARMLAVRIIECPFAIARLKANVIWSVTREDDPAHRYLRSVFTAAGNVSAEPRTFGIGDDGAPTGDRAIADMGQP